MGQTSSNLAKKVMSPFNLWASNSQTATTDEYQNRFAVTPFVYRRRSSMYFDEDGDLAHEFYVEVPMGTSGTTMRRHYANLIPQGDVELPHPRLNADLPIVLVEAPHVS